MTDHQDAPTPAEGEHSDHETVDPTRAPKPAVPDDDAPQPAQSRQDDGN